VPLRIGVVDYLNSRPLAWSFHNGFHRDIFEPGFYPPAEVAVRLAAGEIDIGLLPSIELQRIPGLRVLPGLCIAATHEARSVLLVLAKPLAEVRRIALDRNSRTSAALVEILLADGYGLAPELVSTAPSLYEMLETADAALLIGDPALGVDRSAYRVLDLAAEWRRLTDLPFVFAVWAVREGVETDGLATYFQESLRLGLEQLEELVADSSRELDIEPEELRRYLTNHLSFEMGATEVEALEEFHRRAHAHGLIEALHPVEVVGSLLPQP
jgi:predicted solute-binding protein